MNDLKDKFYLPEGVTYLNCAYMAPLLKSVEEAGIKAIQKRRNPLAYSVDDFFDDTQEIRRIFSTLINASSERIVLIPSVSYGMANVARNIRSERGQNIILAAEQFPSNFYPWKRYADENGLEIKTIAPDNDASDRGKSWNKNIINAIDKNTCFLAISHTHWADGTLFDLKSIREASDQVGALLIIDGTQSVGALPFNVEEIRPDALICAGYKWLMGPYALGLAYYGEYFDGGVPIEENWINRLNSEDFKGLVSYQDNYQDGSIRYEVGEHSNFILVPMLLAALHEVSSIGPEYIQQYTGELIKPMLDRLQDAGYRISPPPGRANHLFGIRLPEQVDADSLRDRLNKEKIVVSWRGDAMRVAPNVYNTQAEMDRFTQALLNEVRMGAL